MAEATQVSKGGNGRSALELWNEPLAYDRWVSSVGIPIIKGYYIDDLRKVQLGAWDERECDAAFIQLVGQEGVAETRLQEIAPGKTIPAQRFGMDEVVYVVEGRGLTTLTWDEGQKTTFEWQKHSMFLLPRRVTHQLANTQGNAPTRLMITNYLPGAMASVGDIDFFLHNETPNEKPGSNGAGNTYSEATEISQGEGGPWGGVFWYGNFFPSMRAWDNLTPFGGGGFFGGGGGSSITQQLVKNVYISQSDRFSSNPVTTADRKLKETVVALELKRKYSDNQILDW